MYCSSALIDINNFNAILIYSVHNFYAFEMVFTNEEMVDMLLIYGKCFQNAKQAEQRYAGRFPKRRHPTRPTFSNIVSRHRETGSLSPRNRIRNKTVTNEAAEVAVLAAVAINPHASFREMEREIGIICTSVLHILHRHQFHPLHISLHQALDDNDFQIHLEYSQWVLHQGHDFMSRILFIGIGIDFDMCP